MDYFTTESRLVMSVLFLWIIEWMREDKPKNQQRTDHEHEWGKEEDVKLGYKT